MYFKISVLDDPTVWLLFVSVAIIMSLVTFLSFLAELLSGLCLANRGVFLLFLVSKTEKLD